MNQLIIKRGKQLFLIFSVTITMFLCSCGESIPEYIATSATVEAGDVFLASDFLLEEGHTVDFADDFAKEYVKDGLAQINEIGKHDVKLVVDGENYVIALNVQDTVPPKALARMVTLCQGDTLAAEQCIVDINDCTNVTCAFKNEPDLTQVGIVNEVVVVTDEGGNCIEVPVTIRVLGENQLLIDKYTIEAGENIPAIDELIVYNKTGKYITDISAINTSLIGSYTLEAEIDGAVYSTEIVVEDTVAPKGTVSSITAYYGGVFPPADGFVSGIIDEGPVTISYESDPGAIVGDQTAVRIVLTDQAGNTTVYDSQISIISDDEAPKFITFPKQLEAVVNTALVWENKVSAEDNSGVVDLSIDTANVKLNNPGTYTAYFVAKDPAGNETRQEVKVIIKDFVVTEEMMDNLCAKIVAKIITEDMTVKEQLHAVYKYVSSSINYTNSGKHDDVRKEAYLALSTRKSGDCFSFYAASNELLNYLGYETQMVRRKLDCVEESGNHYWVLVNCGTKENPSWYHHDSCPQIRAYRQDMYMMTDAQMKAYTNYRASETSKKHYYDYDTSLHPASATEIMAEMTIDSKYYE